MINMVMSQDPVFFIGSRQEQISLWLNSECDDNIILKCDIFNTMKSYSISHKLACVDLYNENPEFHILT